ncbi:peroxidase [Apodospora peruviana]|uniref:Peroxidase n=1 Tax=Apodospora peruviana TaxID=516989 RepID=A0AAE0I418_9PEZI|nr:peroxidase [Apodospora peruviana]
MAGTLTLVPRRLDDSMMYTISLPDMRRVQVSDWRSRCNLISFKTNQFTNICDEINNSVFFLLSNQPVRVVQAFPGMARLLSNLQPTSHDPPPAGFLGLTQVLGDLVILPDNQLTPVGLCLKVILQGGGPPIDNNSTYTTPVPILGTSACHADPCCVHKHVAEAMFTAFVDPTTGECTSLARGALRLGFHDADGSVLLSAEEKKPGGQFRPGGHHESHGDVVRCLFCRRHQNGRPNPARRDHGDDNAMPAPEGLLADPHGSVEHIIQLFQENSFTPGGLAALVGAHTISRQFGFDETKAGEYQDNTPGTWDTVYYNDTLVENATEGVYRFPSDVAMARHESTGSSFRFFATRGGGEGVWHQAFAAEYIRMSLLGVYNLNGLTECTKVLPLPSFV